MRVRKDYSYWKTSLWVPGMALANDSACFVDPVLSSGVHLATYGALLAARAVNSALDGSVPEERGFAEFEARYRREYGVFYEFLIAFYDMERGEDSYFWSAKKVTRVDLDEAAAFAELVAADWCPATRRCSPPSAVPRWPNWARRWPGWRSARSASTRCCPPGSSRTPSAPATTSRNRPCTAAPSTPRPRPVP
ncbi:tryptophan 7-halogenase [Streptomyces lasalocidi]